MYTWPGEGGFIYPSSPVQRKTPLKTLPSPVIYEGNNESMTIKIV